MAATIERTTDGCLWTGDEWVSPNAGANLVGKGGSAMFASVDDAAAEIERNELRHARIVERKENGEVIDDSDLDSISKRR